jgi:hypothetical protein
LLDLIRSDDHKKMIHFVGFDNYFPPTPSKSSIDEVSALNKIGSPTRSLRKHLTQFDFIEVPCFHSLLEVWRKF